MPESEILENNFRKAIFRQIDSQIRFQGLKHKDLAAEFGVSASEYSRAIHGDPTPKAKRLRKMTYERLGMK
ncbi:hypothetical protein ACQW5G_00690 [Fructilactobacillus sp. Tb1]|uniref:hypothetical protein n=1 Tax=Fructilactobacillus sp. Tb1 TaxID=3422304 RepID=UPI003D286A0C